MFYLMNHTNQYSADRREIIPLFFAVDDRYAPFLCVALRSIIEHAAPDCCYHVNILIEELSSRHMRRLAAFGCDNVVVEFINVGEKLDRLGGSRLHLRDYYTRATYYRFFVPDLFPQYDRGLYLDCDIVVLDDIANLYRIDLGDNLVAAAPEEVMERVDVFGTYVEEALRIPRHEYFSAGILLMNLAELRRFDIEGRFSRLLSFRKYRVTQDQDYLNLLCRGRVRIFDSSWNRTAFPDADTSEVPHIIHYKINWKPWHYRGISFENYFWHYARQTDAYEELLDMRDRFGEEDRAEEARQYDRLVELALQETADARAPGFVPPDVFLKKMAAERN